MFSRFTLGCFITKKKKKKKKEKKKYRNSYRSHHANLGGVGMGSSKKFIADSKGEFANPNFSSISEKLNVHFLNTAAESTWQNGLSKK